MWEAAGPLKVNETDTALMAAMLRAGCKPQKVVFRIKIVLGAASGKPNAELARELETTRTAVIECRER